MSSSLRPVVLFFAFANDRIDPAYYLRNLPEEKRRVHAAMAPAVQAGLCEVVERTNVTAAEVLGVFQDVTYRDRIAVFHFGGHANSGALLLESATGEATAAYASGLAQFLSEQRGLKLVFLNGCSSKGHVQGLLDAGVPAVIATSQLIADEVATQFATHFYAALASGTSIRTAYAEARGAVQMNFDPAMLGQFKAGPVSTDDAWPWILYPAAGAEEILDHWSLPQAAGNPLFGLPPLPGLDFPSSPFRYLASFSREEALVFFGRGPQVRELFDALTLPDGASIVLLFGAAGVGKSSLLAAGLQPRLEADYDVLYLRRDGAQGLAGTLARGLACDTSSPSETTIGAAWRLREAATGKPLLVILDQVEEAWTRPLSDGIEAEELAAALCPLFTVRQDRPRGRLLLGFRKEWLAEVLRLLDAAKLPSHRVELTHLDLQGIADAAASLPSSARMRSHYGLEVEPDLPGLLAADLLADPASTVAPALQILLTKMWSQAIQASPAAPHLTVALYRDMKRHGILLDDFLQEQIKGLAAWRPQLVSSGLVLDLLTYHTTTLGSAESRTAEDVSERYGESQEITELMEQCQDRYLLNIAAPDREGEPRTTRLSHDTLAPLVRRRFETSDLPGQRALRILEQRAREWENGKEGPPLDEFDLAQVEAGQRGMRVRTLDEERLVAASRRQASRGRRQRRSLQVAVVVAVAIILGMAVWALRQRNQALLSEERSRDRTYASLAANLVASHPATAALILLEVQRPDSTPTVSDTLFTSLGEPMEIATLTGHKDGVSAASFSPDGTRVVTASWDGTARIWNAATGQPIFTLTGHKDGVSAASFSPDGTRVVTASWDKTARIWNAATGHPIFTLTGHTDGVSAASFSPDGTRVVTASWDKTAQVWNATTGKAIVTLTGHKDRVVSQSFSPDGTRVVTASWDGTARIWNAATGQTIKILIGHTSWVNAASFNSSGTRVVTASEDHTARIWDAASGQTIATLTGHTAEVRAASFSSEGTRVVTASGDGTARIWTTSTGQLIGTLAGHTAGIDTASFSPNGTCVVTASPGDGTARIWDAATGEPIATLTEHTFWVRAASFSPDGTRVVTASEDHTARIWTVITGQTIATLIGHTGGVWAASFSPDSSRVVTASVDKTARIWNAATGLPIAILTGHTAEVWAASFSPDGTRVVTASQDNTARIWNAVTGQTILTLKGHTEPVYAASFSPDGTRVVTASGDHTARIWNAATSQTIATLTGHTDGVRVASFSPDGTHVVTASQDSDHTARIWDSATGQPVAALRHEYEVDSASFSPDGTRVVTVSDIAARIWNTVGLPIASLTGHHVSVRSASFSPDGTRVATAAWDNTARIWNAATGQTVTVLAGHTEGVNAASFSPDSTRVVTASIDRTARLWNAATGQPLAILTGHTADVQAVSFSSDGTRVVTASADQTARIWPSGGDYLQSRVRARTRLCLLADFRQATLGESSLEAAAHEIACKACVPRFFDHLQGVPSGDSRTYLVAWQEYKRCFHDVR